MKKLRLLSLLLCAALLCQMAVPASAAETGASTQETQPAEQQTAQIPFGQVCIENGCRTLNGMRPLAGSDSRLDTALAAFAYETNTETVIYSYNPDTKLPTGTLAKIVTALVAIENSNLDDIVTCSDGIQSKVPGSSLKLSPNLKSGEQLTVNDLLHGLLMIGANDAAVALAEHLAGSEASFAAQMNQRARELGMKVSNVDYPPNGVANFAIMLMLMSLRKAGHILKRGEVQDYSLKGKIGRDISSCTVGVIGTGRIGQTVLKHLSGFGCSLLAYDLYPNQEVKKIAEYVPLETLLAESDVITLHTNATEENHHLLDAAAFAKMKPGVTIVNTARGKLIDSDALLAALESGQVGAAGLDVLENENGLYYYNRMGDVIPNPELAVLRSMPNVILTDHTAFYTHEDVESMVRGVLESAVAFEQNQPTRHDVTEK